MSIVDEADITTSLEAMEADNIYNTPSRYSPNTALYPDNMISFAAIHVAYLRKYPSIDPRQYLQNLKLTTLIR